MTWLNARHASRCWRCSADIYRNDVVFHVRSRVTLCRRCGRVHEARMAVADEVRRELRRELRHREHIT